MKDKITQNKNKQKKNERKINGREREGERKTFYQELLSKWDAKHD